MREKLFLQLFAEDGGANNGEGGEGNVSFDDFLKGEGNQAEFDRRVNKAVQTAVSNAQKKWQALNDKNLSEAEKLAQMTEKEKSDYEINKLKERIAEMERKESAGKMVSIARNILSEQKINVPDGIIQSLISEDAEKTKTSVEGFAKMFKESVQDAVKEALKGNPPKTGTDKKLTKADIMAVKDRTERQRLIAENMDLFK